MILWLTALAWGASFAEIAEEAQRLEQRRSELILAVETRGGFDANTREIEIYEAALLAFMVGDPSEAAMGFHVLLHMGSSNTALLEDSEWYLAASFEKMGFFELASDHFLTLADSTHPLRNRALARLVQIRAERGPPEVFSALYERAVAANRLRPTAEFSYTLGKAQYHLGNDAEATRVLMEIPSGTSHFLRSQYLMAVILLRQGDLEGARVLFERIAESASSLTAERLAADLAALAVARIHFHRKEFERSGEWYGRVAGIESVLDDSMVESLWNQVALEDWGATLLAFGYFHHLRPDHPASGRMRVLEGHVLYKMGRHREAEAAYERVRGLLISIVERMELLDMREGSTVALLRDARRWREGEGLPPRWALTDFLEEPGVKEALALQSDVHWLEAEVAASGELVREITDALSTKGAIGRFQIYRQEADSEVEGLLQTRMRLLLEEVDQLVSSGVISKKRGEASKGPLKEALKRLVDDSIRRSERFTRVGELRADRRSLRKQLGVQEVEGARSQLLAIEAELRGLEELRRRVPSSTAEKSLLDGLKADVHALRGSGYDPAIADLLHLDIDLQLEEVARVRQQIDADEAAARGPILATLTAETEHLSRIEEELTAASERVRQVWELHAGRGVAAVRKTITESLVQAEAGLTDLAWGRLLETRDRIEAVEEERRSALRALDDLFQQARDHSW